MNMNLTKTVFTFVLAAGVLSALPGCTDDEVATTALIIGVAAIAAGGSHSAPDRGGFDHDHGPGGGGFDHGGGRGPGPGGFGGDRGHHFDAELSLNVASSFKSTDERVLKVASNYGISDYAATYVVRAIALAQAKDVSGVTDLGLEVNDFKDLYDGKSLEDSKVSAMAHKLLMSRSATAQLLSDMTSDVQAEKAARGL